MTRSTRTVSRQMNLSLLEASTATLIAGDQQKELTLALMELLINAAQGNLEVQANGGEDEPSQTDN